MSIYASTACLRRKSTLKQRIGSYRAAGLDHIELGGGGGVQSIARLLEDAKGLHLLVHNFFPPWDSLVLNLASADSVIRERSLDHVKRAIELSAVLEAPFYSIHAGFITDPCGLGTTSYLFPAPSRPEAEEQAFNRFISALEVAAKWAASLGPSLLVENNVCSPELQGKLLLQTADEFLHLFDAIQVKNVGVLLDFGHLNVSAHTLGFDRLRFVERIGPYIRAFHVHDNDGTADTHEPVKMGWVLDVLHRQEFTGLPVIVEARFSSVADLRAHVDWLSATLEQPGEAAGG